MFNVVSLVLWASASTPLPQAPLSPHMMESLAFGMTSCVRESREYSSQLGLSRPMQEKKKDTLYAQSLRQGGRPI